MPKFQPAPKPEGDLSPDSQPSITVPAPQAAPPWSERVHTGPLSWVLGGAPQAAQKPGRTGGERRRDAAPQRPPAAVDARRRRSPSSRFRG